MKSLFKIVIILVASITISTNSFCQVSVSQIKSVYIEKFTRFIEWPAESGKMETDSIVFGLMGKDDLLDLLKEMYKNKPIKDKKVKFIICNTIDDINKCNLVFISGNMKEMVLEIIKRYKNSPILLIGDTKNYAKMGIHINFYTYNERVLFEINPDAVKMSNLYISHHLLRAADIVRNGND